MAIDVARRRYYDPSNGMIDIKNRIIRSVGNPHKRINEDALRILRAFRFLGQMEQVRLATRGTTLYSYYRVFIPD